MKTKKTKPATVPSISQSNGDALMLLFLRADTAGGRMKLDTANHEFAAFLGLLNCFSAGRCSDNHCVGRAVELDEPIGHDIKHLPFARTGYPDHA